MTKEINEVSKQRLGAYIKKASDSKSAASSDMTSAVSNKNIDQKKVDNISRKWTKRYFGINRAVDKLTKEEVEQIDEISKERVGKYAVKALASREHANKAWSDAQKAKHKAGDAHRNAKRAGPDKDYGETDANHAERLDRLSKRRAKAEKSVADADRKQTNRTKGLYRAGKVLAKEEESMEKYTSVIEAIINDKPVDAKNLIESIFNEKIEANLDAYNEIVLESMLGIDPDEAEFDIDSAIESLSDEDLEALNAELEEISNDEELDEEEILEVSKQRLGAYVNKAAADLRWNGHDEARAGSKGRGDDVNRAVKSSKKRTKGISTAVKKLTKEEVEQIDEISANKRSKGIASLWRNVNRKKD